jgi:hypothetical protein
MTPDLPSHIAKHPEVYHDEQGIKVVEAGWQREPQTG